MNYYYEINLLLQKINNQKIINRNIKKIDTYIY